MIREQIGRVLFLGAGASVPLGLPRMDALILPVARRALQGWRPGAQPGARRLAEYMELVHGANPDHLEACAAGDLMALPGIVDVLTLLDIAIAENASFGHAPPALGRRRVVREFTGQELRHVHRTLVGAIADYVAEPKFADTANPGAAAYAALSEAFRGEAVVTTNWDTLLDRALWRVGPRPAAWRPRGDWVGYSPLGETVVRFDGTPITPPAPATTTALLKLHGSLNWLCCPRCQRLIVNATADLRPDEDDQGPTAMDDECWCEATADPLIVTPSYSKNYDSLHIRGIWREALRALAMAPEWVFVGYSLPIDDFAVRALLTRALVWKRAQKLPLNRVEVFDYVSEGRQAEAKARVEARTGPREGDPPELGRYLALVERYRAILAGSAREALFDPCGLFAAAARLKGSPQPPVGGVQSAERDGEAAAGPAGA